MRIVVAVLAALLLPGRKPPLPAALGQRGEEATASTESLESVAHSVSWAG